MKVATYNVNSIRQRVPIVLDWLAVHEPDVLAIQETKVEDGKFPVDEIEEMGWSVAFHGQKSYNGVALITREPATEVRCGLMDPLMPEDCRAMIARVNGVSIINTYVPNGTKVGTDKFEYKIQWLERFKNLIATSFRPDEPVIWLGDINIARHPEDVFDSPKFYGGVGHHPREFAALDSILEWGWQDCFRKFTQGPGHYTFWEFYITTALGRNQGWRIDHIYASPGLADRCTACEIDRAARFEEKPSDHTVVWAEFDV